MDNRYVGMDGQVITCSRGMRGGGRARMSRSCKRQIDQSVFKLGMIPTCARRSGRLFVCCSDLWPTPSIRMRAPSATAKPPNTIAFAVALSSNANRPLRLVFLPPAADCFGVLAPLIAQLSDFNGRSLSSFNSSSLVNEPDVPETAELHSWFASAGGGSSFKSVSVRGGGGGSDGEP